MYDVIVWLVEHTKVMTHFTIINMFLIIFIIYISRHCKGFWATVNCVLKSPLMQMLPYYIFDNALPPNQAKRN